MYTDQNPLIYRKLILVPDAVFSSMRLTPVRDEATSRGYVNNDLLRSRINLKEHKISLDSTSIFKTKVWERAKDEWELIKAFPLHRLTTYLMVGAVIANAPDLTSLNLLNPLGLGSNSLLQTLMNLGLYSVFTDAVRYHFNSMVEYVDVIQSVEKKIGNEFNYSVDLSGKSNKGLLDAFKKAQNGDYDKDLVRILGDELSGFYLDDKGVVHLSHGIDPKDAGKVHVFISQRMGELEDKLLKEKDEKEQENLKNQLGRWTSLFYLAIRNDALSRAGQTTRTSAPNWFLPVAENFVLPPELANSPGVILHPKKNQKVLEINYWLTNGEMDKLVSGIINGRAINQLTAQEKDFIRKLKIAFKITHKYSNAEYFGRNLLDEVSPHDRAILVSMITSNGGLPYRTPMYALHRNIEQLSRLPHLAAFLFQNDSHPRGHKAFSVGTAITAHEMLVRMHTLDYLLRENGINVAELFKNSEKNKTGDPLRPVYEDNYYYMLLLLSDNVGLNMDNNRVLVDAMIESFQADTADRRLISNLLMGMQLESNSDLEAATPKESEDNQESAASHERKLDLKIDQTTFELLNVRYKGKRIILDEGSLPANTEGMITLADALVDAYKEYMASNSSRFAGLRSRLLGSQNFEINISETALRDFVKIYKMRTIRNKEQDELKGLIGKLQRERTLDTEDRNRINKIIQNRFNISGPDSMMIIDFLIKNIDFIEYLKEYRASMPAEDTYFGDYSSFKWTIDGLEAMIAQNKFDSIVDKGAEDAYLNMVPSIRDITDVTANPDLQKTYKEFLQSKSGDYLGGVFSIINQAIEYALREEFSNVKTADLLAERRRLGFDLIGSLDALRHRVFIGVKSNRSSDKLFYTAEPESKEDKVFTEISHRIGTIAADVYRQVFLSDAENSKWMEQIKRERAKAGLSEPNLFQLHEIVWKRQMAIYEKLLKGELSNLYEAQRDGIALSQEDQTVLDDIDSYYADKKENFQKHNYMKDINAVLVEQAKDLPADSHSIINDFQGQILLDIIDNTIVERLGTYYEEFMCGVRGMISLSNAVRTEFVKISGKSILDESELNGLYRKKLAELGTVDKSEIIPQYAAYQAQLQGIFKNVEGTLARSDLFPAFNAYQEQLKEVFDNIEGDTLVFKPGITAEDIRQKLDKKVPEELITMLQQSLNLLIFKPGITAKDIERILGKDAPGALLSLLLQALLKKDGQANNNGLRQINQDNEMLKGMLARVRRLRDQYLQAQKHEKETKGNLYVPGKVPEELKKIMETQIGVGGNFAKSGGYDYNFIADKLNQMLDRIYNIDGKQLTDTYHDNMNAYIDELHTKRDGQLGGAYLDEYFDGKVVTMMKYDDFRKFMAQNGIPSPHLTKEEQALQLQSLKSYVESLRVTLIYEGMLRENLTNFMREKYELSDTFASYMTDYFLYRPDGKLTLNDGDMTIATREALTNNND